MSTLLEQASLVMIPSGYKEDVVYSQIPTSGAGDLSFTRASNGTRVNSAGLVEVVPWNLLSDTETLSSWNLEGGTLTSGQTDPNGGSTAYKYVQVPGGGLYSGNGGVTADVKCSQVWIKSVSGGSITCNISDGAAFFGTFNVTGTWQLFTAPYTANTRIGLYLYAISNASGIYVWHPQLNIGSTAKPYFPTTDRLNVPRLTYQNGGGGCPSLLLEKQSTNLALYSEQFDNAAWIKQNSSITANSGTSPDGTQNADLLIDNSTNDLHYCYQSVSTSAGSHTFSFYAKANTLSHCGIRLYDGSIYDSAIFNLSNGTKGSGDGEIESVGNGWYRVSLTKTLVATTTYFNIFLSNGTTYTYSGSGQSIYIWGAQYEASSYKTSLINTTSSSATRVADACFKTGISSLIGQTEGVLFVDVDLTHFSAGNDYILQIFQDSSNRILLYRSLGNVVGCYLLKAGGSIYDTITVSAFTGRTKLAFAYKSGSSAFYVNGSQIGTSSATFTAFSSLSDLNIDSNDGNENGYFSYNQVILFKTRLTNAELASLTTI